jgi:hypothetical protein
VQGGRVRVTHLDDAADFEAEYATYCAAIVADMARRKRAANAEADDDWTIPMPAPMPMACLPSDPPVTTASTVAAATADVTPMAQTVNVTPIATSPAVTDACEVSTPHRQLSDEFGAGASAQSRSTLLAWREVGQRAQAAAHRHDWHEACAQFEVCVALRPEWSKVHECLARAKEKARTSHEQESTGGEHLGEPAADAGEECASGQASTEDPSEPAPDVSEECARDAPGPTQMQDELPHARRGKRGARGGATHNQRDAAKRSNAAAA